jgi:hypothetical protein
MSVGDVMEVTLIYNDGWAVAKNLNTGAEGSIPMTNVNPCAVTAVE